MTTPSPLHEDALVPASPPDPNRDRLLHAAILTATLSLGYATEAWGVALLLLFFLGLHPVLPRHVRIRPRLVYDLVLLLPFAFLAAEYPIHRFVGELQVNLFYYTSFYLCALAIFRLYNGVPTVPPRSPTFMNPVDNKTNAGVAVDMEEPTTDTPLPSDSQPRHLVATVTGCTAVAFGASSLGMGHHAFIGAMAVYTMILFGLFRVSHRRHALSPEGRQQLTRTVFITFNFCVLAGFGLILAGKEYMPALQTLRQRLWAPPPTQVASIGFDNRTRLGDVSENRDRDLEERIAVRVYGGGEPVYLRGRVYEVYSDAHWHTDQRSERIRLEGGTSPASGFRAYTLPGFSEPTPHEAPDLEVYPERRHGAHYLLPLETRAFTTNTTELLAFFPGQVFRTLRANTAEGYRVFLDRRRGAPPPLDDDVRRGYLRIPRSHPRGGHDLRDRIEGIVRDHFPGLHPAYHLDQILERMTAYFADRYTYRLGIAFTPGRDPLEEFLAHDRIRHGHCELFASAGVLLLRRLGIPARYVVGYVTAEGGRLSGGWIAREKHAHAWVEYFHPERGWQTLELTPSDGLPPDDPGETWREYLRSLWQRSERLLEDEGIVGVVILGVARAGGWLVRFFSSGYTLGVLVALLLAWVVRLRYRMRAARLEERVFPEALQAQRETFASWQKGLRGTPFQKQPHETLREYAARIRDADACPDREALLAFLADFEGARYSRFAEPEGRE